MILIITNERDITTDFVVRELRRRRVPYVRLNSERLPQAHVAYRPIGAGGWQIRFDHQIISLDDISAGYFRRPGLPSVSQSVEDTSDRQYCQSEWASVLRSLYSVLGNRWLNSPAAIVKAEDKPFQLSLAATIGMRVPETLVTNDYRVAAEFAAKSSCIAKPLCEALLEKSDARPEQVIFTNRLDVKLPISADEFEVAPLILQREIPKKADIRVTVVGSRVFTAAIESQIYEETSVDWRRGTHPELPHHPHELSSEVREQCAKITMALGLRFAAIDLVLDPDGRYWFLEANPNGQWAWIENRTGLPISEAIVDELLTIGTSDESGAK